MKLMDDKVYDFHERCYSAGIKNPDALLESKAIQVFDWLKGAFPRGILPTDVDGEVEINGHFLRLEFKHETALRNGRVPKGQMMCFERLINTRRFTVMIIGHANGSITCMQSLHHNGTKDPLTDVTREQVYDKCKKWSEWAGRQPR